MAQTLRDHDPAKVVCDLAITLALGGDYLADVATLRAEDPTSTGRWPPTRRCRAPSTPCSTPTPPLLWLRSMVRGRRPGRWCGAWPVTTPPTTGGDAEAPLVIDVNATLVTAHSDKEQARPTFKRGFGFHPVRREALSIRAEVRNQRL